MIARRVAALPPLRLRETWRFWLCVSILIGVGANVIQESLGADLHDLTVYRAAAQRIADGEPLYGGDVTPLNAYRYAPWFAYAWVPLAELPDLAVDIAWVTILLAASAWATVAIIGPERERIVLALMFAPALVGISLHGNVQPVIVVTIMYGLTTRWGWIAVGLAGSLKVVPLAFVAIFIMRRQWWSAIGAVLLAAAMWAPIASFAVDPVTWSAGSERVLPEPIWLATAAAAALVTLTLAWRQSELTTIAAPVAAILGLPRLFLYELTVLMIPARR